MTLTEPLIAAIAAISAALITAGPAYIAARRSSKTAQSEGTATRVAVAELTVGLGAYKDAHERERTETREELLRLRRDVRFIREWQVGHDAEHSILGRTYGGSN